MRKWAAVGAVAIAAFLMSMPSGHAQSVGIGSLPNLNSANDTDLIFGCGRASASDLCKSNTSQPNTWNWSVVGNYIASKGYVLGTRNINTVPPLSGGGNLNNDITLGITIPACPILGSPASNFACITPGNGLSLNGGVLSATGGSGGLVGSAVDSNVVIFSGTVGQYKDSGIASVNVLTNSNSANVTNKAMSGTANTFTNLPNSALTNPSLTIAGHSVPLGGSQNLVCSDLSNAGSGCSTNTGSMATQNANAVAITGGSITGLPTPLVSSDAANKNYVDNAVQVGLAHPSARLVTPGVLPNTPTYANGTSGVGATLTAGANAALSVDGVTPSVNDRILVNQQAAGLQNGIYTVTTVGSGSVPWVLTRATDFDQATAGEVQQGASVLVTGGTTLANTSWQMTTTGAITIGTTPLTWVQTGGSNSYTASNGITLTGNNFALTPIGAGTVLGNSGGSPAIPSTIPLSVTSLANAVPQADGTGHINNGYLSAVPNSALANNSITIGTAAPVALGGSLSTIPGLTLTAPTINGGAFSGTITGNVTWSGNQTYTGTSVFSNTVSGSGINSLFASPPALGSTAANSAAVTTLSASGALTASAGGTRSGQWTQNGFENFAGGGLGANVSQTAAFTFDVSTAPTTTTCGKTVQYNGASANGTVPSTIPAGCNIDIEAMSAGLLTIIAGSGATQHTNCATARTRAQYSTIFIHGEGSGGYTVGGDCG